MSLVVYAASATLVISAILLFSRPRAALRNPLTASTCAAVVLSAICFFLSAPATLRTVNEATGVPNFGAPLTYSMISAYSCSLIILLIQWRGGSPDYRRRMVLRALATYGSVIIAIVALFSLAQADTERLRDLDTYYANAPFMREMIVLYLLGHGACIVVMCVLCLRWAREVTGLLRTGLWLILAGCVLDAAGFEATKAVAVAARWTGHNLDFLSTTVAPPVVSVGALVTAAGFVLPRLLPSAVTHWRSLSDLRNLTPLWHEVQSVNTAPKPTASWWHLPQARLHLLEASIHDALLALAPHFNERVRQDSLQSALVGGASPRQAKVIAEAAMLADAARHATVTDDQPDQTPSTYRLHATTAPGASGLVELAQALGQSPVVSAAREGTAGATHD
ncbi:MAB_1171c family putative transporter [Streptomyces sp. NPDC004528]|uniref:MAB_1171c family putative transporter n=1 Tax=Streptomyces sp. NPDC004528 TaxID=3154550 RepID=UPI0033B6BAD5